MFFSGIIGPETCLPPIYSWPLGKGIGIYELMTGVNDGYVGTISYTTGPLDYDTMNFDGNIGSCVDLDVANSSGFFDPNYNYDWSLQMYIYFKNVASGVFFEYESFGAGDSNEIFHFKGYLNNGDIVIELRDYGKLEFPFQLENNTWYHLIMERDCSSSKMRLYIDRDKTNSLNLYLSANLSDTLTNFPGKLRIGAGFSAMEDSLHGSVACVQFVTGKDPTDLSCYDYDVDCMASSWHSSTSSSPTYSTASSTSSSSLSSSTLSTITSSTSTSSSSKPDYDSTTATSTSPVPSTGFTTSSTYSTTSSVAITSDLTTSTDSTTALSSSSTSHSSFFTSETTGFSNSLSDLTTSTDSAPLTSSISSGSTTAASSLSTPDSSAALSNASTSNSAIITSETTGFSSSVSSSTVLPDSRSPLRLFQPNWLLCESIFINFVQQISCTFLDIILRRAI